MKCFRFWFAISKKKFFGTIKGLTATFLIKRNQCNDNLISNCLCEDSGKNSSFPVPLLLTGTLKGTTHRGFKEKGAFKSKDIFTVSII